MASIRDMVREMFESGRYVTASFSYKGDGDAYSYTLFGDPALKPGQGKADLKSINRDRTIKITRKANRKKKERARSVNVLGDQMFDSEGHIRLIHVVFNEALRKNLEPGTVSQPEGLSWRLCFQLEEPQSIGAERREDDQWCLQFLRQATTDPSLLLPDWSGASNYEVEEYFKVLREACLRYPLINQWLQNGMPPHLSLTLSEVIQFLETAGPELEKAGFGVRLPAWCSGKASRPRLSRIARVRDIGGGSGSGLTLDNVVRVDWELALGENRLTMEELSAIAQLKIPLIQVRGKWVHLSAEELRAVSHLMQKGAGEQKSLREVVQLAVWGGEVEGLPVEQVRGDGELKKLLEHLQGHRDFTELHPSKELNATLRPYQNRGYSWLTFMADLGIGACLADDMGLGKTVQTLAFLQRRFEKEAGQPCLLVCPTSVLGNWRREARCFTPNLSVRIHHGLDRPSGRGDFFQSVCNYSLVITSYSLLASDGDLLRSISWSGVVLDEAQNIKNPDTEQAKAARSLSAKFRIALTGTPVENNVRDLWSIMEFLNPGLLGSRSEFERRFFLPIQRDHSSEAMAILRKAIEPFLLRRLKADRSIITDLPEKVEMKEFCNLTREQATLYKAVLSGELGKLPQSDGIKRKGIILGLLGKLKQVCNHPAQLLKDRSSIPDRSGKLARLTEMLEVVRMLGERALVFTQYTEMGEILDRHLSEFFGEEVLFLHGGLPAAERDRLVERFQSATDGPAIFVLSLRAGGTGLNLTRASHVFHFDRWWNPAVENQATDRAHRIGQKRDVQVHKLLCMGTLEERIDQLIESKKDVTARVVGSGEEWLTELSTVELQQMLQLSAEAVTE